MHAKVDGRPWFREPWPWILMAGPATVVVAGAITIYLAVISSDGLVVDDYYKQGLAINQSISRDEKARGIGVHAEFNVSDDGLHLRGLVSAGNGRQLPETLNLKVVHPTKPGMDITTQLRADGPGYYTATLSHPLSGKRWHLFVEDQSQQWRIFGEIKSETQKTIRLQPLTDSSGKDRS